MYVCLLNLTLNFKEATEHILSRLDQELPDNLYYHGPHHTRDVIEVTSYLAGYHNLNKHNKELLITAAAYHDCGFLIAYRGHEEVGCGIARETLPKFGYSKDDIEKICEWIMATKVPTSAKNLFEEIICDADLDYLGRDDFENISESLFKEFLDQQIVTDELNWFRLQKSFLGSHHYYNPHSIETREDTKQRNLSKILTIVEKLEKDHNTNHN